MNPTYQILVKNKDGETIGEFTEWFNLRFSDRLNNYGECSFDVPVTSTELQLLTALRRYDVFIVRNGVTVWSGQQATRTVDLEANSPQMLTITCYSFFEMLNARYTLPYVRYDQEDQGAILKDLVDTSQGEDAASDFGFTFASIPATVDRNREYSNYNIMEAFINMSNVINGPDFWIDHDKVIHIVPYRGIDKSATVVLEWGINILTASIQEDFSSPANRAIVIGSGFGSSQVIAEYTDEAAKETFSLREQRLSETDVSDIDNLEAKGEAFVNVYKNALVTIDFAQIPNTIPTFGSLAIGDAVRIKIKEGIYDINNVFRIYGYKVAIGDTGEENISYLVSQS